MQLETDFLSHRPLYQSFGTGAGKKASPAFTVVVASLASVPSLAEHVGARLLEAFEPQLWLQGSVSRADILCLRDGKQVSAQILGAASGLGRHRARLHASFLTLPCT